MDLAEYLELEDASEERAEFHDGKIVWRAVLSYTHSVISTNVGAALFNALKKRYCQAVSSSVKIFIEKANSMVYADAMLVCGGAKFPMDRFDIINNPTVVVEVLSPSTEGFDRGGKFRKYKHLKSFREYVLIEQDSANVDVFFLNDAGEWVNSSYSGIEGELILRSLGVKLALADIYRDVEV